MALNKKTFNLVRCVFARLALAVWKYAVTVVTCVGLGFAINVAREGWQRRPFFGRTVEGAINSIARQYLSLSFAIAYICRCEELYGFVSHMP